MCSNTQPTKIKPIVLMWKLRLREEECVAGKQVWGSSPALPQTPQGILGKPLPFVVLSRSPPSVQWARQGT